MSGKRYLKLGPLGIYRSHRALVIRVGRYACHYKWPTRAGRYGNGSRWQSSWHDWTNQPDY